MTTSRRSLAVYFILVYLVTWTAFTAAAASTGSVSVPVQIPAALKWPLLLLGAFAPSGVAILLTATREEPGAVRALLSRLFLWHVSGRWYLFAFCYLAAVKLSAAVVYRVIGGEWPGFGTYPTWYVVLASSIAAMLLGGPLGEEIGWRGYALPRLTQAFGARTASLVFGVLWAIWHLPVFFIAGLDQYGQPFFPYLLYVTALSVAFAFLAERTRGSLLLAVLFHTAVNQTKDIVTTKLPEGYFGPLRLMATPIGWLVIGILWVCALWILRTLPAKPEPAT